MGHYFPDTQDTICPGSSDPFYIVSYYINWVTTSWTHGMTICLLLLYIYISMEGVKKNKSRDVFS